MEETHFKAPPAQSQNEQDASGGNAGSGYITWRHARDLPAAKMKVQRKKVKEGRGSQLKALLGWLSPALHPRLRESNH